VGYRHEADIDFGLIARKELHILGVRSGSARHLREVLDIVSERRIQMPPVSTWHLDEINSALAELRLGSVKGKAVITPN
jgi:D-arabinose 1-dehydrogenase-like Zn-dependent alcohol dehydrogenase